MPVKNRHYALIQTVGYGIQAIQPHPMDVAARVPVDLAIVGSAGMARGRQPAHSEQPQSPFGGTGGSCFGDTSGPLFVNNTNQVAAVVSHGDSNTCHGADYSWRVDNAEAYAFVEQYLNPPA